MKLFVTGVNGQLGHDVMNELNKRGHEGVGSDIADAYAGVSDGSAVTKMPYISLDITEKEAVRKTIENIKPDVVIHCAAWTSVDMAEDEDKVELVRKVRCCIFLQTMSLTGREQSHGNRTARTISRLIIMVRQNSREN